MKRRRKTIPRWQGIAACIIMTIALLQTGWLLYMAVFAEPRITEIDNLNCIHPGKSWYCCKQYRWGTMTNLTTNKTFEITECMKFKPID